MPPLLTSSLYSSSSLISAILNRLLGDEPLPMLPTFVIDLIVSLPLLSLDVARAEFVEPDI